MSIFDLWVKGCEINKTLLYRLEGNGNTALYKTISDRIYQDVFIDVCQRELWVNVINNSIV